MSERTSGELPVDPFWHLAPTAVAELDLDRPLRLAVPGEGDWPENARDTLVLLRLHGEPIDLIHIPAAPGELDADRIASEAWSKSAAAIHRHAGEYGCAPTPLGPASLIAGLPAPNQCSGASPPPSGVSVAVLIPTSRDGIQLERLLRSLERLVQPDLEVIVVAREPGGGATRSVVAEATRRLPGLRYVPLQRGGRALALNLGLASTQAEVVAITDDDVVADPGWLSWLVAPFARPEVVASTGLVLPLELTTPAQKWFELYAGFSKGLRPRTYDNQRHRADDRLLYPYWGAVCGSGNNMAVRRREFLALGGFDPALGGGTPARGGADMDAMTRMVLTGRAIAYEPRALIWHEHRRNEEALRQQIFAYGWGFTAALTKAALHDPRFHAAALRSIPILAKVMARRQQYARDPERPRLPAELTRLELRGMLRGPRGYLRSAALARRRLGPFVQASERRRR
jgi:O-antigen biosynthesis protein